ncbi:metalloregulator ArsR/SmtB family transcription factor [Streptomyces sp. FIT100]|uniref:ArsR/SmtB family transcription factor n=1 Tax=Streptomyces sp. FIT100 TaxID=2837956 RepID=UPI0021C9AB5D|nr:metalloregulator ArsR/SmtB family transcription factor [Streptomyces sp. FIT100]UUN29995.1 helix-turn-helix domain-containing protein [Streptomyces sp. FIT100]
MGAQVTSWDSAAADRAVAVLKAIADPSRYRLLWALSHDELPVSALAEMLGAHVAATSQHLAKLRAAGLVSSRREGTRIYYRADGTRVRELLETAMLAAGDSAAPGGTAAAPGGATAAAQEARATARATPRPRRRPVTE